MSDHQTALSADDARSISAEFSHAEQLAEMRNLLADAYARADDALAAVQLLRETGHPDYAEIAEIRLRSILSRIEKDEPSAARPPQQRNATR
jgi:hypothetical protein